MVKAALLVSTALLAGLLCNVARGDDLKSGQSWSDLTSKGLSVVFGRFEGQFDGPDFRSRKIRFRHDESGKEYTIELEPGRGYFEGAVPPGAYAFLGLEATYFPMSRPMDPTKFRPIRQRFTVRESNTMTPTFYVPAERPVYVGTIRASTEPDGLVYPGHHLRVFDEYDEAFGRLAESYPELRQGLSRARVEPTRHFLLKPTPADSPLEVVGIDDPVRQARHYISEGKYQQAINWLSTFMPSSDAERERVRMLIGEAQLADGKYVEAIETLGDVLVADPENHRALRLLARAHAFNGNLDDAENLYQALAEAIPNDAEAHLQLGYLYAISSQPSRSAEQFASAFAHDFDYLLHDMAPFVVALKAAKSDGAQYEPPELVRAVAVPPRSLRSRRGAEMGNMALLIDHHGKVIAAQVGPENSGPLPLLMMTMIRSTFKPAVLNGIPVPALLTLGGEASGPGVQ